MQKRNTIQKQLILKAVKALDIHATAEQVYDFVVKENPSISKATVYRNLNKMAQDGELLNIGAFFGAAHYDHNLRRHYHFVCNVCGSVFDVDGDFDDLVKKVSPSKDFTIKDCNISFNGLCGKCDKRN